MRQKRGNKSTWPKRLLSLLLTVGLAVTMLPQAAFETKASALSNPRMVADASMQSGGVVTWDCVWFGRYPQSQVDPAAEQPLWYALEHTGGWDANNVVMLDGVEYVRMGASSNYKYYRFEPIKWRVLEVNGDTALLLSDLALDRQLYHTSETSITWEKSTIRSWLNGYSSGSNSSGIDYSRSNFIDTAFSASEQAAIKNTNVVNENNSSYGTSGGKDTCDKLFLLSESEVCQGDQAAAYGFARNAATCDESRRCKSSAYAKARGVFNSSSTTYAGNTWWWLRSPGNYDVDAMYVGSDGWGDGDGYSVYTTVMTASGRLCI